MASQGSGRMSRINEEVRRELADILRSSVKDPRLGSSLLSVMQAETSKDLKYCKVSVSVLGSEEEREAARVVLKNAAGFIRRELAHRLNLRNTPELTFVMDDSIEYSIHISKLLADAKKEPNENV